MTLQASDNNGHFVTIKLTSQLNDISGNLNTETFIKLQKFHILRCSYETNLPACSVMLCTLLKIIGFSHVLVIICKLPKIEKIDESTKEDAALKEEAIATNFDGKLCSRSGLHFCKCITSTYKIENKHVGH